MTPALTATAGTPAPHYPPVQPGTHPAAVLAFWLVMLVCAVRLYAIAERMWQRWRCPFALEDNDE